MEMTEDKLFALYMMSAMRSTLDEGTWHVLIVLENSTS